MAVVSLWIYEADWFAVFMDLLVLVGLGRVCFGVKRGGEGGGCWSVARLPGAPGQG